MEMHVLFFMCSVTHLCTSSSSQPARSHQHLWGWTDFRFKVDFQVFAQLPGPPLLARPSWASLGSPSCKGKLQENWAVSSHEEGSVLTSELQHRGARTPHSLGG